MILKKTQAIQKNQTPNQQTRKLHVKLRIQKDLNNNGYI